MSTHASDGAFTIFGAGLSGPLMAAYLGQAGYEVDLHEMRADPRAVGAEGGRSINLALSLRGTHALAEVGALERVHQLTLPMPGRMMHAVTGNLTFQPYGTEADQVLYSVSRGELNRVLLDVAEASPGVRIHFGSKCADLDLDAGTAVVENPVSGECQTIPVGTVIGADGAFSKVRAVLRRRARFDYSQSYLDHGYKELCMPARPGGGYALDPRALHIWPRRSYMMIALPNQDETFTCTLFWPFDGPNSFDSLRTDDEVLEFFRSTFPDALPLFPNLIEEYRRNPVGSLVTVKCKPWHVDSRAVLIGDACHAVVPFYGQGMNASFEDCTLLSAALARSPLDRGMAFAAFQATRKEHADALADLAVDNFVEMRDKTASKVFLFRRAAGRTAHKLFPNWFIPLYTMVTFTRMPYGAARRRARLQDRVVLVVLALLVLLAILLIQEL